MPRSGDVAIAYQEIGEGDRGIVFARGFTGDLLSTWEQPLLVRHVVGLASVGRALLLDRHRHSVVRTILARHAGREIDTAGESPGG